MSALQYRDVQAYLSSVQDKLRTFENRKNGPVPCPEKDMTYEQWWNSLPSNERNLLSQYDVSWQNVKGTSVAPYFTYTSPTSDPKPLYVVDQDFFNQASVTQYKNKSVTRYRTEYYSYPVWVRAGRCGCHSYIAYWATGSYQVAYTDTIQVPAAYSVAVESITPHKIAEDHATNRTVQVPYTDYSPVWVRAGRCGCHSYIAYYQPVTRYRSETQRVVTLELKDQVPLNDDKNRAHLFAPAGASPDGDNNVTFGTDSDGNIVFQNANAAAAGFAGSGQIAEVNNNPAHPRAE